MANVPPAEVAVAGGFPDVIAVDNGDGSGTSSLVSNAQVVDELLLQYLRKRGYHITPLNTDNTGEANNLSHGIASGQILGERLKSEPTLTMLPNHHLTNGTKESDLEDDSMSDTAALVTSSYDAKRRFLGEAAAVASAMADEDPSSVSLETYAQQLGLNTESCAANHILFYGMTGGDPQTYEDAYGKLLEWICNSLDMYKYELHAVAFPMFVHCFLELVSKGFVDEARKFFHRHLSDHTRLHLDELRRLSMVCTPEHVRENEYAQLVLHSKFNIQMSLLSFELLNTFLSHERLFLLLAMLNERVNLIVTTNQPGMQLRDLDPEVSTADIDNVVNNVDPMRKSSGYKTSDQIAQIVGEADEPNESEIVTPLTSGEYNVEYMVHAAGGEGQTLEDLHAIKVHWGVLPGRKLHIDSEEDDAANGATTSKDDEEGGNAVGGGSGAGGGTGSTGGNASSDTGPSSMADAEKKSAGASSSTGDGGVSGRDPTSSATTKAGDKTGEKALIGEKSGLTSADAQRKAKRAKLSADGAHEKKKSELEVIGPVPDRRSPYNADILEKVVLRQPAEMKAHSLEDLRARAVVGKSNLPSSLCFTFLNSSTQINNMCFSDDVTMVGASCDDGSFRVWRNDEQPLGTATGSVYHGSVEDADEEERKAVLRGHSSAVYGASFSPDNRFALTASADSTIRLWSLAAKSNMVIYRSHSSYPVWDVTFAPVGYYFASCSMDRTARLWSTDHITPLRIFAGHLSDVDCVKFHPNHNYLATGSSDKTVRLWDVQSGKCIRVFTGHFNGIRCLAFSRNGRYLASSGEDQYINIWDLQAGKRLETLVGHKAMVTSLDFSQESSILASAGMDCTVRLWDMKTLVDRPATLSANAITNGLATVKLYTGEEGSRSSKSSFVKPVHMVRPNAMQELPSSRFLLKTLRSKQTPMYRVHFTPRNLLLSGGVFQPKVEA